jgi:hypothetical protein
MPSYGVKISYKWAIVTPDDGMICMILNLVNHWFLFKLVFYFVILPSVSPIAIVLMYHLVPTSVSFAIIEVTSQIR